MMKTIFAMTMLLVMLAQQRCPSSSSSGNPAGGPGDTVSRAAGPEARILGAIDYPDAGASDVVTAPAAVQAGQEFQVTITTFGGGCERAGDTGLILAENGANVMVYDFTTATRPDVACTMVLKRLPHTVTLRFDRPGEALIRIWGRRIGADAPPAGVPVVLDHRVMVTPVGAAQVPGGVAPVVSAAQLTVTETGIGPVRVGMTVAEAMRAWGGDFRATNTNAPCYYLRPAGTSGVALMVIEGRIARVDVSDASVATFAGARVGDSEARIKSLYPAVEVTPHKYVNGHYLTVLPSGDHRIIFETDGVKVTRFRAGRMPEVGWIEGCS